MPGTYVCKRLRLCRYLMEQGFYPYKIADDRRNPAYTVYLFEQSDALTQATVDYYSDPQNRKREEY